MERRSPYRGTTAAAGPARPVLDSPAFEAGGLYTIVTENDARPDRIEAEFLASAPRLADCPPPDVPEVVVAGRSNAGKSSVLNQLTRNRQLARTSKTPGRTQLLNFFSTRGGGRLVDLPGYGYAKAGKHQQAQWQRHVEEYLERREALAGVFLVMDVRHPLQPFDRQLIEWAHQAELPMHILLNKSDKLGHGARQNTLLAVRRALGDYPRCTVQLFSASTGFGRDEAIALLLGWLDAGEG
jgi:GTP-binding protein